MKSLVGYTGFVGSNLYASGEFDAVYNSKNIAEAYGTEPDILYYAGLRAEKFLANKMPEKDMELIQEAIENIKKINPKKLVLISTIDVYKNPVNVDEDSTMDTDDLHPYGYDRYVLEQWVEQNMQDYLIVRLPGLFGKGIKKNFIYDFIHVIPAMLTEDKMLSLNNKAQEQGNNLLDYYAKQDNGFYKYIPESDEVIRKSKEKKLREIFGQIGFSALQFTDSRGIFQFYDLADLYTDLQTALDAGIHKLNLATEPVGVAEIYQTMTGQEFHNEILDHAPLYDYQTKYASIYHGQKGYMQTKSSVLEKIKKFIQEEQKLL